jgi:integrase
LSLEEARRFLAAAQVDRFEALYVLGLSSGMRLGELGRLFWSDTDLTRRVLHVQRSLIIGHGQQSLEAPKTPGSRRSISLTVRVVDALLRHQERQQSEGLPIKGDALVFRNKAGKPLNPSHLCCRSFEPLLKRAGLQIPSFMLRLVIPAAASS